MILEIDVKKMLIEIHTRSNEFLFSSSFEMDERGQNGREKR